VDNDFSSQLDSETLTLGPDKLDKLPPHVAPSSEIHALKIKMARTLEDIKGKKGTLTVQDLKRLLFRCAATLISVDKVNDHHRYPFIY